MARRLDGPGAKYRRSIGSWLLPVSLGLGRAGLAGHQACCQPHCTPETKTEGLPVVILVCTQYDTLHTQDFVKFFFFLREDIPLKCCTKLAFSGAFGARDRVVSCFGQGQNPKRLSATATRTTTTSPLLDFHTRRQPALLLFAHDLVYSLDSQLLEASLFTLGNRRLQQDEAVLVEAPEQI